jgi:cytochrome P450
MIFFYSLGMETATAVLGYGDTWRVHRKLFHQTMGPEALVKYRPFYTSIATSLVQNLLQLEDGAEQLGRILQS